MVTVHTALRRWNLLKRKDQKIFSNSFEKFCLSIVAEEDKSAEKFKTVLDKDYENYVKENYVDLTEGVKCGCGNDAISVAGEVPLCRNCLEKEQNTEGQEREQNL